MPVTEPCYCTREDVQRAPDYKTTARATGKIDRAIQSAARDIDGRMHRVFYPTDATRYFDWPNFQYAYPWRLWLDQWELAGLPTAVTSGGVAIPLEACNFEPVNSGPPFTYLELRRDLSYSFGNGPTPQRDIAITGPYGHSMATAPAGQLAAAISSTTATTVTVSDGSLVGVGDLLIADTERMLVSGRANTSTGQTVLAGLTTATQADNAITVADGTQLHADKVIQVDSERMIILDVTDDTVTVQRAWDGSVLTTHTVGATIYAPRLLTVARGQLGTAAASHADGLPVSVHRAPSTIRDLAIAVAVDKVRQETGGYTDPQGTGPGAVKALGKALPDLWDAAVEAYGRKARSRVI